MLFSVRSSCYRSLHPSELFRKVSVRDEDKEHEHVFHGECHNPRVTVQLKRSTGGTDSCAKLTMGYLDSLEASRPSGRRRQTQ